MKRLNVVINDDSFTILKEYQEAHKIGTRDGAVDEILREFAKMRRGKNA